MCQATIRTVSRSLDGIDNAELLRKIKEDIALFIETMEGWGYSASLMRNFQLVLFHKYAELLQRSSAKEFQEVSFSNACLLAVADHCTRLYQRMTTCP